MIVKCRVFREEKVFDDYGKIIVFGFEFYNDSKLQLQVVNDVFTDETSAHNLASLINANDIDEVHIMDIIEDALVQEFTLCRNNDLVEIFAEYVEKIHC